MKQSFTLLTLSVLLFINITGCSVVRFAETRAGYGVKPANKAVVEDFHLGFGVTGSAFSVRLEYQPYKIYKPEITPLDLGVGLASLGVLGKVVYDNWEHDGTFTFVDDTFDWYDLEPWERAVIIGVPADILLYWAFSYLFDRRAVPTERQPLTNYRYRIELPDYGNIGIEYPTKTGKEQIDIRGFLADLGNPAFLQGVDSLKFRASIEVGPNKYTEDYTLFGFIPPLLPPRVEINPQWDKNHLRPGEKATLKVTVKNTNKTVLTGFRVITMSSVPHFDNHKLIFAGDIAQGASETRSLGVRIAPEMSPQDLSVRLRFKAADRVVHPELGLMLHIIK